jgi:hypothetical protein
MSTDGLELRREKKQATIPPAVEGLLTESISEQMKSLFLLVPQRRSEHPVATADGRNESPLQYASEQHLGVGVTAKAMASPHELRTQLEVVVGLAVVRENVTAIGGGHRLMPIRGEVQDSESPVRERHARRRIDPGTLVIGTSMGEGPGHAPANRLEALRWRRAGRIDVPSDPAHD